MIEEMNQMNKFDFLLGKWNLEYRVPKSQFSEADSGEGEGEFKRVLNDRYVTFDYHAQLTSGESSTHAIFAWDEKRKIYRYWWFEGSGAFMKATCNFIDENTLYLNWHDSILVQTFSRKENGNVVLEMSYPKNLIEYEVVLEVIFTTKK
jgi:hypothetical protein